jgi:pheromone a factor receptor
MRLYIICIVWIIGYVPVECYVLYFNINNLAREPYSWSSTHDPQTWKEIIMVPSGGTFTYTRWIWLSCGFAVFVFFGFGRDAVNMYRTGLLAIGLGRIFPSLRQDYRSSITATMCSYGSKARMFFNRKSSVSNSTWKSTSDDSQTSSSDPYSPKKEKHIDPVGAIVSHEDGASPSFASRILSKFRHKGTTNLRNTDQLPFADLGGQPSTVVSAVTAGPRSPTLLEHVRSVSSDEMMMRMELRQNSEQRV